MPTYLGPKTLPLAKLKLPGDLRARAKRTAASGLEESLKKHGQLQRLLVRKSDMTIIAGGDRATGLHAGGAKEVNVELWDATDAEVLEMRAAENAYRRHSQEERDKWLADLHRDMVGVKMAEMHDAGAADEAAVKAIAKAEGVKPGTVERAIRRAKAADKPKADPVAPVLPPGFQTFGVAVEEGFVDEVWKVYDALERADRALRSAQGAITDAIAAEATGVPMLKRLHQEAHEAADQVRELFPGAICVYCKTLIDPCNVCGGRNWISVEQFRAAPEELRDWKRGKVIRGGKIVDAPSAPDDNEDIF